LVSPQFFKTTISYSGWAQWVWGSKAQRVVEALRERAGYDLHLTWERAVPAMRLSESLLGQWRRCRRCEAAGIKAGIPSETIERFLA
jgi:hypothetical protein